MGVIRRAEIEAADRFDDATATTALARLVAIGVDRDVLLNALSKLTRLPVASPQQLEAAAPMKLAPSVEQTFKEHLAVPIGRIDDDILEVAVADPRTSKKLRAAAIAHHACLALEADVVATLARVFPPSSTADTTNDDVPEPGAALNDPTQKNVPLVPKPISTQG